MWVITNFKPGPSADWLGTTIKGNRRGEERTYSASCYVMLCAWRGARRARCAVCCAAYSYRCVFSFFPQVRQSKGTTSEVRKRLSCSRTTPKPARARPTLTKITSANRCTTLPRVNRPPPLPLWPPEPPPAQASRRSVRARRSLAFWGHVTASLGAPARIALGASED